MEFSDHRQKSRICLSDPYIFVELARGSPTGFWTPPFRRWPCIKDPGSTNSAAGRSALIIDDDKIAQEIASKRLQSAGLDVLIGADGLEGVELFRNHVNEIGVGLLDMTMPDMNGSETYQELRKIDKTTPVILSSGYGEREALDRFADQGLAGFIKKPYRMADFVKRVLKAVASPSQK